MTLQQRPQIPRARDSSGHGSVRYLFGSPSDFPMRYCGQSIANPRADVEIKGCCSLVRACLLYFAPAIQSTSSTRVGTFCLTAQPHGEAPHQSWSYSNIARESAAYPFVAIGISGRRHVRPRDSWHCSWFYSSRHKSAGTLLQWREAPPIPHAEYVN